MARGRSDDKKDDITTAVFVIILTFVVMAILIWLFAGHKLVLKFSPFIYQASKIWQYVPFADAQNIQGSLYEQGAAFTMRPRDAGLLEWLAWTDLAMRPFAWLTALFGSIGVAVVVASSRKKDLKRQFVPKTLAERLSFHFTGSAPVLHLRSDLVRNKDYLWRRQVFPSDVFLKHRVAGKPLVVDGKLDSQRTRDYFMGLEPITDDYGKTIYAPKEVGGRMASRTLGHQVVSILLDRHKKGLVFPDRFSSTGKVIYALLCAYAFGGEDGKREYAEFKDKLNNSARGAAHGFCNLTVAQELFNKYRLHPVAAKLFQVHHWEYTYLWALLIQAKRQGKVGHWDWMWLKPMNRGLFYCMNTVGRSTPHTESAIAFSQFAFERGCFRRKRLPIMQTPDKGYEHVIFVPKVIRGFSLEWDRWVEGEDEGDDDIWRTSDIWDDISGIRLDPPALPPSSAVTEDSSFDDQMRSERTGAQKAAQTAEFHEIGGATGIFGR